MDRFPQMLYKAGGALEVDGKYFSTLIVEDDEALQGALAEGWIETTGAALEAVIEAPAADDDIAPPTREELEAKATELGIEFSARTSDRKLGLLIVEKLKA